MGGALVGLVLYGVVGTQTGWAPGLVLATQTCAACWALRDERATWCLVDSAVQHQADTAPAYGLALVRIPPTQPRGGVGQLQLRVDGEVRGDVDLAVCGPCQRAVLEQVRVDPNHRRQGLWPGAGRRGGRARPGMRLVHHHG
jgi:hypothetical protein